MRSIQAAAWLLSLASSSLVNAESNLTDEASRIILPTFHPPQHFENVNLLRTVNLEKSYPRETVNVIIQNIDSKPRDEYFIPFSAGVVEKVGALEVKDKKEPEKGFFKVDLVDHDPYRYVWFVSSIYMKTSFYPLQLLTQPHSSTQYYRVRLSKPLAPKAQQTLSISYAILQSLKPLPATILQNDKQFLVYSSSAYSPSVYKTQKQKTKIKFPNIEVPDFTEFPASKNLEGKADPQRQGSSYTYGPYGEIPAGATEEISFRYEFTKPVSHVSSLERDIEVSHWGGNLATEERYVMSNLAANLSNHFSRVSWASTSYYNPPTTALKMLSIPLKVGSLDPYFVDDIGNVSTSRFRSNTREALLELKPRYPVFGGWRYKFKVGWNNDLKSYLRKTGGDGYVLKVPFLEGPKAGDGFEYEKVEVRVILPEGAT